MLIAEVTEQGDSEHNQPLAILTLGSRDLLEQQICLLYTSPSPRDS